MSGKVLRMPRKVIVIAGTTGSGKTDLAIAVAKSVFERYGRECEIIAADSRTVYRGMDIGTAKPSLDERGGVKHWGFDLVDPDEHFTAKDFCDYAKEKIEEIEERGNVALVVGGTGLYIDSLVYGYSFTDSAQKSCSDRVRLDEMYKIFALKWERGALRERLFARVKKLFNDERLEEETVELVERYGWDCKAMTADIYGTIWEMMRGEINREEAMRKAEIRDWHLAKRQLTWFRRNGEIEWLEPSEAEGRILEYIEKEVL